MSRNIGIGEVRTKLLDTDHKQWNCGMGLYDPNKVFFTEDPNGKVIVDGKLCSIVRSKSESNLVMIGDKFYKFVQIGDQIWLAENLALEFPNATYYNGDPAQSFGLLYRGRDMGSLNDLLLTTNVGWHVPTMEEINNLVSNAGGQPVAGKNLKSSESWDSGEGLDVYGFNMKAAGLRVPTNYQYKGSNGSMWSCVMYADMTTPSTSRMSLGVGPGSYTNTLAWGFSAPVRLIKDTDPVEIDGKIYHTAKIGNQIWTIENLDWIIPGIAYNVTTIPDTPAVWYYDYADKEPKERAGALYNAYAAKYINDNKLVPGWHVACWGDYQNLLIHIGGTTSASLKLRNWDGWETEAAASTNDYRFNAIPAGNRSTTPSFVNIADYALFYTDTIDGTNAYRLNINRSNDPTYSMTTAKNGLSLRLVKDTKPVTIGNKTYKTVQIGNRLWTAENLDYIFEGLNIGGEVLQTDVHAWYYNNDASQSEGLMYNGYAASYLAEHPELLPDGWRLPTIEDLQYLLNFVTNTDGAKKLKATGNFGGSSWGGIDACHFDGKPAGIVRSSGQFTNRYDYLRLWTDDLATENSQRFMNIQVGDNLSITTFDNNRATAISIRLVKDMSSDDISLSKGGSSTVVIEEGKDNEDEKPVEEEKKDDEVIETKK